MHETVIEAVNPTLTPSMTPTPPANRDTCTNRYAEHHAAAHRYLHAVSDASIYQHDDAHTGSATDRATCDRPAGAEHMRLLHNKTGYVISVPRLFF